MKKVFMLTQLFNESKDCLKDILESWDSCHDLESVKKEVMKKYRIEGFMDEWKNRKTRLLLPEPLTLNDFYSAFKDIGSRYIKAVLRTDDINCAERFLPKTGMLYCFAGCLFCLSEAEELPSNLSVNKLNNLLFTLGNWFVRNGYPVDINTSAGPKPDSRIYFMIYRDIGYYYLYGDEPDDNVK